MPMIMIVHVFAKHVYLTSVRVKKLNCVASGGYCRKKPFDNITGGGNTAKRYGTVLNLMILTILCSYHLIEA